MLVYACPIGSDERWKSCACPGIERTREPGDRVITRRGEPSVQAAYNSLLDEAAQLDDVEGVVLLHDDVEIVDPAFAATVRRALAPADVAIVGSVGARGATSMALMEGSSLVGSVLMPPESPGQISRRWVPRADVDVVDGMLMIMSPDAARRFRFDERFALTFHGYDRDICRQARVAGFRVRVEPLQVIHYSTHGLQDPERKRAFVRTALVWDRVWGADEPRVAV